ncbi:TPA: helix-turn-helix transcriptional regulator, partial [Enterobacter ludwigii]
MTTISTTHIKSSDIIDEIDNIIASLDYAHNDPDTAIRPAALLSLCIKQLMKVSSQLTERSTSQPDELPTSLRGEASAQQQLATSVLTTGERIRVMRKLLGMTQGQVAEAINVTKQAISLWESNN